MNPAALNRLDRKSLLSLAQKHKIPRPAALSKEQLVQKLTVKCEVQPSVKRQTTKKVPPKPQIATFVDKKPVLGTSKPKSPLILPTKKTGSEAGAKNGKIPRPLAQIVPAIEAIKSSKMADQQKAGKIAPKVSQPNPPVSQPPAQKSKAPTTGKRSQTVIPQPVVARVAPPSPIIRLNDPKPQKSAARDTSSDRSQGGGPSKPITHAKTSNNQPSLPTEYGKDRVVVLVRDPHWVHCYWELSRQTMHRAQTALGQDFETAQLALRLVKLGDRDCGLGEQIVREFLLPDGARNWYLDVPEPGTDYCVDVGYRTRNGRYYCMGRSNSVSTPRVAWGDQAENSWTEQDNRDAERLFALSGGLQPHAGSAELRHFFEEKLGHNPGSPAVTSLGSGGFGFLGKDRNFTFNLDADLVVHGTTEPSAKVTFQGEPIPLRPDGTFSLRFRLEDGRHIMPAVSVSCTGMEERTIVLAVERNTKTLEPVVHEEEE